MNEDTLTPAAKAEIDAMSLYDMLRVWRFAPGGDARFMGARGDYYQSRMFALRRESPDEWVRCSKEIGWKWGER